MRARGVIAGATAILVIGGLGMSSSAHAITDELALNGTYTATSNGDWAKTREVYHDEATVTSTWTITSTCTDPYTCTGQVTSDQGWTAPLKKTSDTWELFRDIPNWEPCGDGSVYPGQQEIRFWPVDESGFRDLRSGSPIFAGEDRTVGPSGACGVNNWLVVRMPFRLQKVS